MTTLGVLERFVKLVDAFRYANMEVEDAGIALVLTVQESRELYHRLITDPTVHYYAMGAPGEFNQRTMHIPGYIAPPPMPSREHNVWGSIFGITVVIKGMEDE